MAIIIKTPAQEIELENCQDCTVIELARNQGLFLKSSCGGKGKCGRCLVNLLQGEFLIEDMKIVVSRSQPRKALSCLTRVQNENAVIEIPPESIVEECGKIVDDFVLKNCIADPSTKQYCLQIPHPTLENQTSDLRRVEEALFKQASIKNIQIPLRVLKKLPEALLHGDQRITVTLGRFHDHWSMIDVTPCDTESAHYGLAIDIGTTTVVGLLVDLITGEIVGKSSLYNRQITVAEDVISRISIIKSQIEVDLLKSLVIDSTVNPIIKHLCNQSGVRSETIHRTVLSGNTIMMHLLLGLNPTSIGKVPFQPVIRIPGAFQAKDVGIEIIPTGIVDLMPSVSGYIGGDIMSDIYVSKLHEEEELSVLIDIGTNGEIVMSENGHMVACSTAAGPAFEGYGLHQGSRAVKGAVERITFDKDNHMHIEIIGQDKATGICGTGVIDFIAEGLRIGLLNGMGRFNDGLLKNLRLDYEIRENGKKVKACIIARKEDSAIQEPIVITEKDISKILQAKAAIYAGMRVLLEVQNKVWQDIKKLVLTGGFARHIDPHNAISIGLIPPIPEDQIEVIGNGSLAGAYLALLEPNTMERITAISSMVDVIELNMHEEFQNYFIDALILPAKNRS